MTLSGQNTCLNIWILPSTSNSRRHDIQAAGLPKTTCLETSLHDRNPKQGLFHKWHKITDLSEDSTPSLSLIETITPHTNFSPRRSAQPRALYWHWLGRQAETRPWRTAKYWSYGGDTPGYDDVCTSNVSRRGIWTEITCWLAEGKTIYAEVVIIINVS